MSIFSCKSENQTIVSQPDLHNEPTSQNNLVISQGLRQPTEDEAKRILQNHSNLSFLDREIKLTYCQGDFCPTYQLHRDGKVTYSNVICYDGNCMSEDGAGKSVRQKFSSENNCNSIGKVMEPEGSAPWCNYERFGQVIQTNDGELYIWLPFPKKPAFEALEKIKDGSYQLKAQAVYDSI
ncbi:MAG: hypothetical protein CL678_01425 [Bdellovibrionaceae bacterium]|nr:hypothetical protein [Pseudobdellovibrionaceae bacterium]